MDDDNVLIVIIHRCSQRVYPKISLFLWYTLRAQHFFLFYFYRSCILSFEFVFDFAVGALALLCHLCSSLTHRPRVGVRVL